MERNSKEWGEAENRMEYAKTEGSKLIGEEGSMIIPYLREVDAILKNYNHGTRTEEQYQEMINFRI